MKDTDYPGIEPDAVALIDTIEDGNIGPDGYTRIEATEALWAALQRMRGGLARPQRALVR